MSAAQDPAIAHPPEVLVRGLEDRLPITFFRNFAAGSKQEERWSLSALANRIRTITASEKSKLPWLKLARFGEVTTPIGADSTGRRTGGSLRHDANVLDCSGLEADYDGEIVTFDEAVEKLTKAGVLSIVYSSPSHSEDAPRWRVCCPFSTLLPPGDRTRMMGRLNGLFSGIFSGESWTLSQAYYFGAVGQNPSHQVEVIEGQPIDLLDELDEIWVGKPATKASNGSGSAYQSGSIDEAVLLNEIAVGISYHTAQVRLLGRWARDGVAYMDARGRLVEAMHRVPPDGRDDRWQSRLSDIDRCLDAIYGKEAQAKDQGKRTPRPDQDPGYAESQNAELRSRSKDGKKKKTAPAASNDELRAMLATSDKGEVLATHANMLLILKHDPQLQGLVQFNAFSGDHMIRRPPPLLHASMSPARGPYPRPWDAEDVTCVLAYAQQTWAAGFRRSTVEECLMVEGRDVECHPVREYLNDLVWDQIPRVDTWLAATFKCARDAYHDAIAAKIMIAAVRRVRIPGCKHDHMVILEGFTGIGKSTAIQALFSTEWFSDQLSDIRNKDSAIDLRGKWCVELGELEQIIKTDVEPVRAYLSRSFDHYRPPYGKRSVDVQRQNVFIGTTNAQEYLRDTDGNRRMWSVYCPTSAADIPWLIQNRDQLWAEAAHREAKGESIWLDDPAVKAMAVTAQAARMVEEVWHERVADYLAKSTPAPESVTVANILAKALQIEVGKQEKKHEMRVAGVLKLMGWTKKTVAAKGHASAHKAWFAPGCGPSEGTP